MQLRFSGPLTRFASQNAALPQGESRGRALDVLLRWAVVRCLMPFTEKERAQYLAEKKKREAAHHNDDTRHRAEPVAVCVHCQNGFGVGEGVIERDVAICDVCNGD